MFETGGLALLPKMDGVVGKGCVEDAKIDVFVAAMNHTFLLFPNCQRHTARRKRDSCSLIPHQLGKCAVKKKNRYLEEGDNDK